MSPEIKVSFIIPVYNQLKYTIDCLNDIVLQTKISYEIIVVDNNSTDGTEDFIKGFEHKITYIKNESNLGFAKAVNQGIQSAAGKYCLLINNDVRIYEDIADKLTAVLKTDDSIGISGIRYVLNKSDNEYFDINFVSGSCMCFNKKIIEKI